MTDTFSHENALRQVEEFRLRYGKTTLDFACHAALPVALNCELIHFLRVHFFTDSPDSLPWTAEADLVFSPIMTEIDTDLYEIPREIRDILLKMLGEKYGHKRIRQIASLLWHYTRHKMPWLERTGLERAQELTALHCLDPEKAEQWLDEAENHPRQRGTGDREWFVAMRDELGRRAAAMSGEPEDESGKGVYRLRDTPRPLSEDDVRDMIKTHNFYCKKYHWAKKWCNESGDFKNDFTDNGDGTVTDSVTGLMWEKGGWLGSMSFDKAQDYADSLNRKKFAGYSDWRLPTIEELASLLENKKKDGLYIDPVFDRKQLWCWSSDRRLSGGAWLVYFDYGYVDWDVSGIYVRCVRA